jgi:hypothetical protein
MLFSWQRTGRQLLKEQNTSSLGENGEGRGSWQPSNFNVHDALNRKDVNPSMQQLGYDQAGPASSERESSRRRDIGASSSTSGQRARMVSAVTWGRGRRHGWPELRNERVIESFSVSKNRNMLSLQEIWSSMTFSYHHKKVSFVTKNLLWHSGNANKNVIEGASLNTFCDVWVKKRRKW